MVNIRYARQDDIAAITSFTTGTFDWGDYVPDSIGTWMDETGTGLFVATDDNDAPIGFGRCALLTPTEAWLHAARVHPDHRGQGIAGEMAVVITDWARTQGAQVARLMVEERNESSIRHISKTAFRKTTIVHRCVRELGEGSPVPSTNGGTRRRSELVARTVNAADAEMVTASWTASEPGRRMRGLVGANWTFHRLQLEDTIRAATESRLWDIGGSWAITKEYESGEFEAELVSTSEGDASAVARSLVDLATGHGATEFEAWIADLPWLVSAFEQVGCDIESSGIWEMAL